MKKIFLALFFVVNSAHAAFMIDTITGFSSSTDSKTSSKTSDISNHTFIGASIGAKQRAYIGQNITYFSQQLTTATVNKINTLELGPRLVYFFTDENVFYVTVGWNPYAKGKRTVGTVTEDVSGYALMGGMGAEVKVNRNFYIGGSLNYHSLNISKAISASNVATTASDKYNSLMPMINLSLRFH